MAQIDDGGMVFPRMCDGDLVGGLSLRDLLAGLVAAAIRSNESSTKYAAHAAAKHKVTPEQSVSIIAYAQADALIADKRSAESHGKPRPSTTDPKHN